MRTRGTAAIDWRSDDQVARPGRAERGARRPAARCRAPTCSVSRSLAALGAAEREVLDRVEPILDPLERDQRPQQPGAQQPAAHRRDRAIDLVEQRAGRGRRPAPRPLRGCAASSDRRAGSRRRCGSAMSRTCARSAFCVSRRYCTSAPAARHGGRAIVEAEALRASAPCSWSSSVRRADSYSKVHGSAGGQTRVEPRRRRAAPPHRRTPAGASISRGRSTASSSQSACAAVVAGVFRGRELAGGEIEERDAEARARMHRREREQERRLARLEIAGVGQRAGRDDAHDLAPDQALGLLRILDLLARRRRGSPCGPAARCSRRRRGTARRTSESRRRWRPSIARSASARARAPRSARPRRTSRRNRPCGRTRSRRGTAAWRRSTAAWPAWRRRAHWTQEGRTLEGVARNYTLQICERSLTIGAMVILALDTSSAGGSAAAIRVDGDDVLVDRARRRRRAAARRAAAARADGACCDEAGATLERRRSLRGRRRAGLVHRAARRHRDHAGARARARTRWSCRSRPSKRSPGTRATERRPTRSPPGSTRIAAKSSRRCSRRTAATVLAPPTALAPGATLDAWRDALAPFARVRFLGDGAVRYRDVDSRAARRAGGIDVADGARRCWPAPIGRIAAAEPERAVRPHALVPLYVRRPDVELARDRRARGRQTADARRTAARRGRRRRHRRDRRRSKPSRSPTPGRARCSSGSCAIPTSRGSTCCATTDGAVARVLRLLGDLRRAAHQHPGGRAGGPPERAWRRLLLRQVMAEAVRGGRHEGDSRGPGLEYAPLWRSTTGSASTWRPGGRGTTRTRRRMP